MGDLVYVGQYVEKQSLAVCLYRVEVITVTYFYYWGSCLVSGWLAGQTDIQCGSPLVSVSSYWPIGDSFYIVIIIII